MFLANLSKREKSLFYSTVAIISVSLVFNFLIRPLAAQWGRLNQQIRTIGLDINILPGGNIRIDEKICELIKSKKILTLANNGRHVLLELPEYMFIDISFLLEELSAMDITAIISHPERNLAIAANPDILKC